MRTNGIRAALACGLAAALAACGGSSQSNPKPCEGAPGCVPVDTSTVASGAAALLNASFSRAAQCQKPSAWIQARWPAAVERSVASLGAAVAAGRVRYDQASADACLAWLTAASCAALDDASPASCDAVVVGQVANGSPCLEEGECANGTCEFGATCPGTCTAFLATGASCTTGGSCRPGETCDGTRCVALTAPGGAGQPCSNGDPACLPGSYCADAGAPPSCTARVAAGERCDPASFGQCAGGLACVAAEAGVSRCAAFVGEGADCAAAPCGTGLYCASATRTCVRYPVVGEACTEADVCADGSVCLGTTTRECVAGTVPVGGVCDPAATSPAARCAQTLPGGAGVVQCRFGAGTGTWSCVPSYASCD